MSFESFGLCLKYDVMKNIFKRRNTLKPNEMFTLEACGNRDN